jgi:sugar phosphate isomerase/epimerase
LAADWGIHALELRGIGAQRVPLFSDFQKQRVRELLDEFDAQVVAISPGLFKFPYPARQRERFPLQVIDAGLYQKWHDARSLVDYHLHELLPASLEYAKEIGAGQVVIFSFARGTEPSDRVPDEILEILASTAQQAEQAGLQLVIEVENQFWADSGKNTAALIKAVNQPALGVNWDPGNSIMAGEIPYPNGYEAVREHVRHVHFKDVSHDWGYCYAINGVIDWAGQLRALAADGYQGYISVEPHMQPKVASAKALASRLKELMAAVTEGVPQREEIDR